MGRGGFASLTCRWASGLKMTYSPIPRISHTLHYAADMQNLLGAIDTELYPPPQKKKGQPPHPSTVTDSSLSKHITSTPSPYTPNPKTTPPLASTPLSKRGPHPPSPLFSGTDVVREESRHREKKGGSQVTARARERERRRYSM